MIVVVRGTSVTFTILIVSAPVLLSFVTSSRAGGLVVLREAGELGLDDLVAMVLAEHLEGIIGRAAEAVSASKPIMSGRHCRPPGLTFTSIGA